MVVEHLGVGGDFDGILLGLEGLERVSEYPAPFDRLVDRGWGAGELQKLNSGTILRVLADSETSADI